MAKSKIKTVAVDFDGTIVWHEYPDIGSPIPGAFFWLKDLEARGVKIILWTMRSGFELQEAVDLCRANDLHLWGVNQNPTQHTWTQSPKVYASAYIDDNAVGTPLRENPKAGGRPGVDWDIVGPATLRHLGL